MKAPHILIFSGAALALAACAGTPANGNGAAPGDGAAHVQCRPGDYQDFVGRHRSTLPEAPRGRIFRVACASCAVTMDYRDNRVTFTYDDDTEVITRVSCG